MIMKMRKEIIFNTRTIMYLKFDNMLLLIEQNKYLKQNTTFLFFEFFI